MKRTFAHTLFSCFIAFAFVGAAHAALERIGPINNAPSVGGYPAWFQDKTGLALEFCDLTTQSELNGGWCVVLPATNTFPETYPSPFGIEHFYYSANADATVNGTRARLIIGMEGAFANNRVVPGDQITFGRIRVDIRPVPYAGTYTIYHPYGKWIFPNVAAGDRIFYTQDIGLSCVGTFSCALNTDIGPYLLPSATPGGAEVPPIPDLTAGVDPYYDILAITTPYPGTGKKYIADPARIGPVTGSPLLPFLGNDGTMHDHNSYRVEGPNGFTVHTTSFTLGGRIMTGAMPGNVRIDRASFAQSMSGTTAVRKVDTFATGQPTTQGRIPAQPQPAQIVPSLILFDAPCSGTVNADGTISPPYTAPAAANQLPMSQNGILYWGQAHPAAIPTAVCVEDANSRDANGNIVPTFYNVAVVDEITPASGSGASWDPANGGALTVSAVSSDAINPPVLTVPGFGTMTNGSLAVSPLSVAPANITVTSSEGGTASFMVQAAFAATSGGSGATPIAQNDVVTIYEDCSATAATSCATPQVFTPLANDLYNGGAIPAGSVVAITSAPRLGTATVNADGTISYTPNPNVNGSDAISYTVTVNGATSNVAQINVTIQPVNDPPTAVNDSGGAVVGTATSLNLIANDTDPDGAADLANAVIVTWPAGLGTQPTPVNGVITYTPVAAGTFTFTYRAQDRANALSANTATVTITATSNEVITVTKSQYRVGNFGGQTSGRWTVTGNDNIISQQTLSIVYNNGTLSAAFGGGTCNGTATNPNCVIGTAIVGATGAWSLDRVVSLNTKDDPNSATVWASKPTTIRIYSSSPILGGSTTSSF